MGREKPEHVWNKIWSGVNKIPPWDAISDRTCKIIKRCLTIEPNTLWIEAGSGTGRISIRLAKEYGINVMLLDTSVSAIKISKNLAQEYGVKNKTSYVLGSIFNLPLKSEVAHVIWDSGVLEHFSLRQQQKALREFMRCVKPHGRILIIVPNKFAIFYNAARMIAMKIGTWQCGCEEPISYRDFKRFKPHPKAIFSIGLLYQFDVIYIPYISLLLKYLREIICVSLRKIYDTIDLNIAGYFLVAIWVKNITLLRYLERALQARHSDEKD